MSKRSDLAIDVDLHAMILMCRLLHMAYELVGMLHCLNTTCGLVQFTFACWSCLVAGRGTKSIESFMAMTKEYSGVLRLGEGTPSCDCDTEVNEHKPWQQIKGGLCGGEFCVSGHGQIALLIASQCSPSMHHWQEYPSSFPGLGTVYFTSRDS